MILGLNKLCGRPWWMGFEKIDGLAIERLMGIRHIDGVGGLCPEIYEVKSIRALRAKAAQERQALEIGLIRIEGRFEKKFLFATRKA